MRSRPIAERLWEKVHVTATCWIWTGTKTLEGYGSIRVGRKMKKAHRVAYELCRKQIPQKMTLDHLCKNTSCVNPAHLEIMPLSVNIMRGNGACARNARKTHCKNGHLFSPENIYRSSSGGRGCLICRRNSYPYWVEVRRRRNKLMAAGEQP